MSHGGEMGSALLLACGNAFPLNKSVSRAQACSLALSNGTGEWFQRVITSRGNACTMDEKAVHVTSQQWSGAEKKNRIPVR